jgi:flagellar basal-body rod modification protein FlgD
MIGGVQGSTPAHPTTATGLGAMGSEAFLQLLVAQLRYQNPLQPSKPNEMLAQTAQFATIETLRAISEAQQSMIGAQNLTGAIDTIGRHVSAVGPDGTQASGIVDSVTMTADGPVLHIGDRSVPFTHVQSIQDTG